MKELQKLVSSKDAKAQRKTTTKIIMGALTRKKLQNNRKNYLAQRSKELRKPLCDALRAEKHRIVIPDTPHCHPERSEGSAVGNTAESGDRFGRDPSSLRSYIES
jgi:hypothetical protein